MSYFLGIPEEAEVVAIPGCEEICPLNKFLNLTKNVTSTNEDMMSCEVAPAGFYKDQVREATTFTMESPPASVSSALSSLMSTYTSIKILLVLHLLILL